MRASVRLHVIGHQTPADAQRAPCQWYSRATYSRRLLSLTSRCGVAPGVAQRQGASGKRGHEARQPRRRAGAQGNDSYVCLSLLPPAAAPPAAAPPVPSISHLGGGRRPACSRAASRRRTGGQAAGLGRWAAAWRQTERETAAPLLMGVGRAGGLAVGLAAGAGDSIDGTKAGPAGKGGGRAGGQANRSGVVVRSGMLAAAV